MIQGYMSTPSRNASRNAAAPMRHAAAAKGAGTKPSGIPQGGTKPGVISPGKGSAPSYPAKAPGPAMPGTSTIPGKVKV